MGQSQTTPMTPEQARAAAASIRSYVASFESGTQTNVAAMTAQVAKFEADAKATVAAMTAQVADFEAKAKATAAGMTAQITLLKQNAASLVTSVNAIPGITIAPIKTEVKEGATTVESTPSPTAEATPDVSTTEGTSTAAVATASPATVIVTA